jgi:murein DD-endopeptidase MepM/ murein hydrolase activator NlpD
MDKKMFNKSSNFFKREGFYVILFICLCIVATVAVVATRNSNHVKNTPIKNEVNKQGSSNGNKSKLALDNSTDKSKEDVADAKQVQGKVQKANIEIPDNQAKNNQKENAAGSASSKIEFVKPVEGLLARAFSDGQPVYWDSIKTYRENNGIDIQANIGKAVVAAYGGVIESVNYDRDGEKITIKHDNGLRTIYSNLNEKVMVVKGQTVKAGTQIGTVGKTANDAAYEKYGDHLHFEVMNGSNYEDPAKYVKYQAMK